MSDRTRKALSLLSLFGAIGALGIGVVAWRQQRSSPTQVAALSAPDVPPYSESRYLTISADAHYVGAAACKECHASKHQSYALTPHSRALADVDLKTEPPDGAFFHPASGRSYRIYRKDGQLHHEEVLRTEEGEEIGRVDMPVRYVLGSGAYARAYVVERDGFLYQSPLTWYASKNKWDMAPGYDIPRHWGFERTIRIGCLECHAGQVEPVDGAAHRMTFHEKAIGCENCHGPGSLHAELHQGKKYVAGTEDWTIVNPAKLSRDKMEAICALCHLNGPANILLRGRRVGDYRPGMPLTDYRIDYRFEGGNEQMTVVGHVEQLRQSACYQQSAELSCVTCHDPHAREKPADTVAYYRGKCLECHQRQGCKLDEGQRRKKEPADSCIACHMPRGDTEIPHIAFTHHRIGKHGKPTRLAATTVPRLVPASDVSGLSPLDQKRNLGLAYREVSHDPKYAIFADLFRAEALKLLEAARAGGLRDPETTEALAELYLHADKHSSRGREYAQEVVNTKNVPGDVRLPALLDLIGFEMEERNFAQAVDLIEELMRLRKTAHERRLLAVCYLQQDQPAKALPPLREALSFRPYWSLIHTDLAQAYAQLGDHRRAAEHRRKARWLQGKNQE